MAEEFHFEVVDARKPPEEIQDALRAKIQPLLRNERRLAPKHAVAASAESDRATTSTPDS